VRIGPHDIGAGAFLAPMAGITDPPFRMLCREMGASLTVTELISAHALVFLSSESHRRLKPTFVKTLALAKPFFGEHPFAVQLFGGEPSQMAEAAQYLESQGAEIIDLNFGCPARKVVKHGEGAGVALMLDPPRLTQIAETVVRAVNVPVTAKIRTGWSIDTRNASEIAKRLESVGISAICVHARTRDQIHSGPIDLETLAATCQAVRIPVIGNGGIKKP